MNRNALVLAVQIFCLALGASMHGQVSFFQPPTFAGMGSPFVADFSGDGKLDILTSDGTMNLGNGDGTFQSGTTVSGGAIAVADFNGDGRPDVLQQGTGTLLVLLGKGDGTFQAPVNTASGAHLLALAAGDISGDGKADAMGIYNNALLVYLGKGDGSFVGAASYSLGVSTLSVPALTLGDFNGDGKTDVAVSIAGSGALAGVELVFVGNGDGTFQAPKISSGIGLLTHALAGDFNGDGKADLAVTGSIPCSVNCPAPEAFLFLGNGDGTFQAPTVMIADSAASLVTADLNGDGKLDLLVNGMTIYLGNGDGTFRDAGSYVSILLTQVVGSGTALGDFNGDGKLDIATYNAILLSNGDGSFQGIPVAVPPSGSNYSDMFVVGKFNNNASQGVAALGGSDVFVLSNNGSGVLSLAYSYPIQGQACGIGMGDFNADGDFDLVVVSVSSSIWGYSVLLGNGDGSFQSPTFYQQGVLGSPASAFPVVVADLNGDQKPDILVGSILAVLIGKGDGTFAAPVSYYPGGSNALGAPLVADFNAHGKPDIAVSESVSTPGGTAILYGNGNGTFQAAVFPSTLQNFATSFTADVNGDGKLDLIGGDVVALSHGDGTFVQLPPLPAPSNSSYSVQRIGDLNGDGRLDLTVLVVPKPGFGYPTQCGVLLGLGDGTFGAITDIPTCGQIADMNNDGRADLVVGTVFADVVSGGGFPGISVLLNTTSPIAPDFTIGPAPGESTSQIVTTGQTAVFDLKITGSGTFSGTVNLTCAITPTLTLGPTCGVSASSVQISGTAAPSVTVSVAPSSLSSSSNLSRVPSRSGPLNWSLILTTMLVGFSCLRLRIYKHASVSMTAVLVLAVLMLLSCGGESSTPKVRSTPSGTYTATVTASSGPSSHNVLLTVTVQ